MTIHSTNNVLIENNVCFDIAGNAFFFLENAIEVGNRFIGNLGMMVRSSFLLPSDAQPSTFWITNANNTFIGNVASGSDNTGFWYFACTTPLNGDAGLRIQPEIAPWGVFDDNIAHTCRIGLRFDEGIDPVFGRFLPGAIDPRAGGTLSGARVPIIVRWALIHHAYDMGYWIRTTVFGDFICEGCIASDNRLSYRLAFHHQLRDALVVGASNNYICSRANS
jgi:hypothetical protein